MLEIKPINFDADLPQVLNLIKTNLDSTFSEDFFLWKHLNNPFGVSFAMGAWDADRLVGLRLFLRWEFVGQSNTIIKSIRPVDTVTHNDYRGQGIFKSLTLKGLEMFKSDYDLIFNTPNHNSLPGYLKMGWKLVPMVGTFVYALVNPFGTKLTSISFCKGVNNLPDVHLRQGQTFLTKDYLQWRYQDSSFRFICSNDTFVIYKIGNLKGLKTLIVYEISGDDVKIASLFSSMASKEKTVLFFGYFGDRTNSLHFKMIFKRNTPVVVWRDDKYSILSRLQFSLGDLEGRL